MAIAGDYSLRCRKCEGRLGRPKIVEQNNYALVPNEFGAIVRRCSECYQLWLGYMQMFPKGGQKIILKMIDKEL